MSATSRAMRQSFGLRLASNAFLVFWCVIAAFPIFWILVMSFKSPVDAFASNPLDVVFGPATLADGHGLSIMDMAVGLFMLWLSFRFAFRHLPEMVEKFTKPGTVVLGWIIAVLGFALGLAGDLLI